MTTPGRGTDGFRFAKGEGWIFVVLVLGIVGIGESLKVFRAPALLPIVLVAAVYARETMLRRQNLPLLSFSLVGLAYVVLSYLNAFSPAWTRYFDTGVILQQASFLAVLLPLVAASQKWWEDYRFDDNREAVMIAIIFFAFLIGPAIDIALLGWDRLSLRPLATLRNYVLVGLLALSYLAFRSTKWRTLATFALLILLGLSLWRAPYVQNVIIYLIIVGFLVVALLRIPVDRLMLYAFLTILLIASIAGIQDPLFVFEIDENTGWRLAWWRDALQASRETWGVGLGFGTESIRNEYAGVLLRDQYREEGGTFLLVSTHNAFVDTLFRTGVLGLVLFLVVLARCFPHPDAPLSARAHCCAMFAVMTLCLHSNLGLQSPMYSLGIAICIGYLQSERRKAQFAASIETERLAAGIPSAAMHLSR